MEISRMSIDATCLTFRLAACATWVTLVLFSSPLLAVNCVPDSITLSSQAQVNSFPAGCDTIVSDLTVTGGDITDLTPLSDLTTGGFGSTIKIDGTSVTSLAGLDGLTSVHRLEINNNSVLTSITALSALFIVEGPLFIQNNAVLVNVDGLEGVTGTGGALWLANNNSLADLSGLSNLVVIQASLVVDNNDALTNLNSLAGLEIVSANISVSNNDALTDMSGLSGLLGFSDALYIRDNSVLVSIGSLPNLTDIGGLVIDNNDALINLDGFSGLATLGNNTALAVFNNDALTNIDGLAGVVSAEFDVEVTNNTSLSQCSGLEVLLDQVDDAQVGPGIAPIPDVGGDVTISGNLEGCNTIDEILGVGPPPGTECPGAIFCDSFEGDGVLPTGQFSGMKWEDLDGNGQRDGGEPGLPGVTIYVDLNSNGELDQGERTKVTDANGDFGFTNQAAGSYRIREVVPEGFTQTFPTVGFHEIVLETDAVIDNLDFGNMEVQPTGISGFKWNDLDGDGFPGGGEPGLADVTIYLDLNSNGVLDEGEPSTITGFDGSYVFEGVAPGKVRVREVVPDGFNQSFPDLGYHEFTLDPGDFVDNLNFGNSELPTGKIFGHKWNDLNGNAARDHGEPPLGGVKIYLDLNSNAAPDQGEPSRTTFLDGSYFFTNLEAGSYLVREVVPDGFTQTFPSLGFHEVSLGSAPAVFDVDFGNVEN